MSGSGKGVLRAVPAVVLLALALAGPLAQGAPAQLLVNGGFEDGAVGWQALGGSLAAVAAPVHGGQAAGAFTVSGTRAHEVSQGVDVQGGGLYRFGGYLARGPASVTAFLRLSWHGEPGGVGPELAWVGPVVVTFQEADTYYPVAIEGATAPAAARSARAKVVVAGDEGAVVYLDDLSFTGPPPASPAPTPSPTPAATPSPAPTSTPSPTPTLTPTPSPTPSPSPTPTPSPPLVNPSFEEAVQGVPVGWRLFGGQLLQVAQPSTHGSFAAAFSSNTASTKWAFQVVAVEPGRYYSLSALALKNDPNVRDLFLRVSWHSAPDASDPLIRSDDSSLLSQDAPSFQPLTTGPVLAPAAARSAQLRLMLRPVSDAPATAFFDNVQWQETAPPSPTLSPTATPSPTPTPAVTPPPQVGLRAGWNVAFPLWQPALCKSPSDAFRSLLAEGALLAAWQWLGDTQSWLFFFPSAPAGVNTLDLVCGGQLLWLNLAADAVWTQGP